MFTTSAPDFSGSHFDIDVRSGVMFHRFFGTLTPAIVLSHLLAASRDKNYRPGVGTLADIRGATVTWTQGDVVDFRSALFQCFPRRLSGRWALIADLPVRDSTSGVTRLFENLYLRLDAKLFRDIDLAMRWLEAGSNSQQEILRTVPTARSAALGSSLRLELS